MKPSEERAYEEYLLWKKQCAKLAKKGINPPVIELPRWMKPVNR